MVHIFFSTQRSDDNSDSPLLIGYSVFLRSFQMLWHLRLFLRFLYRSTAVYLRSEKRRNTMAARDRFELDANRVKYTTSNINEIAFLNKPPLHYRLNGSRILLLAAFELSPCFGPITKILARQWVYMRPQKSRSKLPTKRCTNVYVYSSFWCNIRKGRVNIHK